MEDSRPEIPLEGASSISSFYAMADFVWMCSMGQVEGVREALGRGVDVNTRALQRGGQQYRTDGGGLYGP